MFDNRLEMHSMEPAIGICPIVALAWRLTIYTVSQKNWATLVFLLELWQMLVDL